jgi:hypothetical protein
VSGLAEGDLDRDFGQQGHTERLSLGPRPAGAVRRTLTRLQLGLGGQSRGCVEAHFLQASPVSAKGHPECCLAVIPVHTDGRAGFFVNLASRSGSGVVAGVRLPPLAALRRVRFRLRQFGHLLHRLFKADLPRPHTAGRRAIPCVPSRASFGWILVVRLSSICRPTGRLLSANCLPQTIESNQLLTGQAQASVLQ